MAAVNKSTGDLLSSNDVVYLEQDNYSDFLGERIIDHGFWLNDLYFQVPPERISSQEENNYAEFQAIRSTGSSKIPVGIASEVFTISFNLTHKNSIVNVDTRNGNFGNTGKRGGILDLILQFKHVPISVIENAYLRSKLKVPATHNMVFCLHNLSISTSPGEPGVLIGQLTISPMAYTCYSDRWYYKKDWISKDGFAFEDVNKIDLPGRIEYKVQNFLSPAGLPIAYHNRETFFVNKAAVRQEMAGETYYQSLINPMFQTAEALNHADLEFMQPYEATQFARESAPFKAYMDWIHFIYTNRTYNNETEDNKFDFTQISPYGLDIQDIGDVLILRWKEFKKIQIDSQVSDRMKLYIKRKIAVFRHDLFKESANSSLIMRNTSPADAQALSKPSAPPKSNPQPNLPPVTSGPPWRHVGPEWNSTPGTDPIPAQKALTTLKKPDWSKGQSGARPTGRAGFKQVMDLAKKAGDPFPEVVAVQWAIESGWGAKMSGQNNPFGQTGTYKGKGTRIPTPRDPEGGSKVFIDFDTLDEAILYRVRRWAPIYMNAKSAYEALMMIQNYGKAPRYAGGYNKTLPDGRVVADWMSYVTSGCNIMLNLGIDPKVPGGGPLGTGWNDTRSPGDIWGGDTEAKRISDVFNEALDSLPSSMSKEEQTAFAKYKAQIQALKNEGWNLYTKDLTAFDTFYRTHDLAITTDSSAVYPHPTEPISCEFISGAIFNLFKKIPVQGIIYPTAQYLGKTDNTFLITFKGNGLNTVKKLDMIKDTLKKQGIIFKHIPEAYCLEVENKLINAFGDKHFVINAYESSTVPEQPGTYSAEYRLTANNIIMSSQTIKRESLVSDEKIKMAFLDELFENSKDQKNIYLTKDIFDFTVNEAANVQLRGAPGTIVLKAIGTKFAYTGYTKNAKAVWWKGKFRKSAVTAKNLGLTDEHISFMNELCAHINLCNKLIIPNGYKYAEQGYKLEYPKKKIITKFKESGFLESTLASDEPLFYIKEYKPNTLYKVGATTETETYQNTLAEANDTLDYIATVMWDMLLEKSHVEYDISDSPLRTFAFTFSEGEDLVDYARAKLVYTKMGDLRYPFPPYIAAHRAAMAVASATWLAHEINRLEDGKERRSYYPIPQMFPDPYARDGWTEYTGLNQLYNFVVGAKNKVVDIILPSTGISNFGNNSTGGGNEKFSFFPKEMWVGGGDRSKPGEGSAWFGILAPLKARDEKYTLEDLVVSSKGPWNVKFYPYDKTNDLLTFDPGQQERINEWGETIKELVSIVNSNGNGGYFDLHLPNKAFMDYVFNYLIVPYLNNILKYDEIYKIAVGTDYFPKTRALLITEEQSNIGPAYNDLLLPYHPYWNANGANLNRGNTYTEPDFYLVNPGTDTLFEDTSQRIESKLNMTPDEAYNKYISLQTEFAFADIDMLQESQVALHADFKVGKMDRREDKQINAVKFDLHNAYHAPATLFQKTEDPAKNTTSPPAEPVAPTAPPGPINTEPGKPAKDQKYDEHGRLIIRPTTDVVEWKDVSLIFGDNLDLISSLNSNTDGDGKFLSSRLLNWDYQSYDMIRGEDAILAIRNGWDKNKDVENPDPNKILTDEQKKLPKEEQDRLVADWKSKNLPYKGFAFKDSADIGNGDSSPYINFSNTRYPTQLKLNEAIKSVNKRKLAVRRAFPVCKVYFFDEDSNKNSHYLSLDECYSYSNIESVQITESRKRPASMCKIAFSDPNGVLSGFNQWNKALHNDLKSNKAEEYENSFAGGSVDTESSNAFMQGTRYEQSDVSFVINAGLKIKVCLGFSNDANRLEEVFLGEITDVMLDNGGNRVEVLAMGYGAELVAKIKGVTGDVADEDYVDTFSLLANLMFSEEILHFGRKKFGNITMFGEGQSLKRNQVQFKETFGIAGMVNSSRPGGFPNYAPIVNAFDWNWFDSIADAWNNTFNTAAKMVVVEPLEGPQDDNIFAPNYLPQQAYNFYDWFKRFSGKVSKEGDYRIVSGKGEEEPTDWVDMTAGYGLGLGGAAGIAGGVIFMQSAFGTAAAYGVAGGVIGLLGTGTVATVLAGLAVVGIGILAAVVVALVVIGIVALIAKGVQNEEKQQYDSPQLIQIYAKEALIYNLFYCTVWDVFEEMTLRHPGYVKYPRIYGKSNRMTMFFGLPDQNMWENCGDPRDNFKANRLFKEIAEEADARFKESYGVGEGQADLSDRALQTGDDANKNTIADRLGLGLWSDGDQGKKILVNAGKINEFLSYVVRRFKPFRRWHNVNSYTDIISNDIEATSDGWYTEVNIQFVEPQWFNSLSIDSAATDAADKVEAAGGEFAKIENPNSLVSWDKNNIVTKKANVDLPANMVRSTTYQFPNCRGIGMAKTYARSMLAKQAKEMYKGTLTILGNPSIRPYDVCMIADTYNNIYGPIEVEEVNHIFTPETGYITVLSPDTFVVQEDMTPYILMNGVMHDIYTRTEYYMNNTILAYPAYGNFDNYTTEGRTYYHELDKIMKKYSQQVSEMNTEMDLARDMFEEITDHAAYVGVTSIAVGTAMKAGSTVGTLVAEAETTVTVGAAAVAAAPVVLAGLALAGVAAAMIYFYASSTMTQVIMDYIADSRAFFVIPLVREGIPMIAGTTIGNSSGMYKSPMQYIRQYWMDGGMGRSMKESDLLMNEATVWERNGGQMDSLLARSELWLPRASMTLDALWNDLGDDLVSGSQLANISKRKEEIKKMREEKRKAEEAAKAAAGNKSNTNKVTPAATPAAPPPPAAPTPGVTP
ncbi:MAG: hypothetical protein EB127_00160 [Alphaproteobacteria bacterium]|nr:hypothetical protein [Alphaproteobacteria bacterium]